MVESKKSRKEKRKERMRIRKLLNAKNRKFHANLPKQEKQKIVIPDQADKDDFYASWRWRTLRMEVLLESGKRCMCCGATPDGLDMSGKPVRIVVDHIKSIHLHWPMRFQKSNLQVLCDECNQGKGAWDETDHRKPIAPDEWLIEDEIPSELREQLFYRIQ